VSLTCWTTIVPPPPQLSRNARIHDAESCTLPEGSIQVTRHCYDEGLCPYTSSRALVASLAPPLRGNFCQSGEQVRGVDNFATGRRENLTEILGKIDFRQADILDLSAMNQACTGVDYVSASGSDPVGAEVRARSHRKQPGKRGWHSERSCGSARCQGEAGHLCGVVVSIWRHANAAQHESNDAGSDFALMPWPSWPASNYLTSFYRAMDWKPWRCATSIFLVRGKIRRRPTRACWQSSSP